MNNYSKSQRGKDQVRIAEERIRSLGKTTLDRDLLLTLGQYVTQNSTQKNDQGKSGKTSQKYEDAQMPAGIPMGMMFYVVDSGDQIADAWRRLEQERAQESEFRERFELASNGRGTKVGYTLQDLQEAANILQQQGYRILPPQKHEQSKPKIKKQKPRKPKP